MISTLGRQPWFNILLLSKPFRILPFRVHFKEWKDLCFVVRFKFPNAALFTAALTSLAVLHVYPFTAAQYKWEPEQSLTITVRKNSSLWGKVDSTEPRSSYTALTQTHRLAKGIQPTRSLWEETGRGIPNKETGKLILAETRAFLQKLWSLLWHTAWCCSKPFRSMS